MNPADIYRVETVEPSTAPRGLPKSPSWCRYVIASRESRVVGRYCGSLAQTRRNAERLVNSINERTQTGRSVWAQITSRRQSKPLPPKTQAARR
jgi:hypothetical protein